MPKGGCFLPKGSDMPVTCEIRDSILVATLTGTCGDEVTAAISKAMNDPAFKVGTSLLLDVRACTDLPSSNELSQRAVSLAGRQQKGLSSRCAVVIGKSAFEFGVARMASTHADIQGVGMEIFTDFEAALHWLERANEPQSCVR
jgi:hypothetical protein